MATITRFIHICIFGSFIYSMTLMDGSITTQSIPTKTMYRETNRIMYRNLIDLKNHSDFIWIVEAMGQFEDRKHVNNYMPDGSLSDFYTVTTIKVLKVFKWEVLPNSIIEIVEPISTIKEQWLTTKIALDDYQELPPHKASLVFLAKNTFWQLWIHNAQNSVFPLGKDEWIQTNNPDRSHIYQWIIDEKIIENNGIFSF